jgi:hypothetical protein
MIQRMAPSQVETDLPVRNVMEATWRVLQRYGCHNTVIDVPRGRVQGAKGASLMTYGKNYNVDFYSSANGHTLIISIEEAMQGSIDFGKKKREIAKIADEIVEELGRTSDIPLETPLPVDSSNPVLPIASPTGGPINFSSGNPIYGASSLVKRGTGILIYGLLGVSCCQIAAPFALIYGIGALREYKKGDPGDKPIVWIGTILGGVGVLILAARIAVIVSNAAS